MFEKISTSVDQSNMIINEFGMNYKTADMYYSYDDLLDEYNNVEIIEEDDHFQLFPNDIPSWSLTRLIKLMPTLTDYGRLSMVRNEEDVTEFRYGNEIIFGSPDPVDAAVQMIEWLLVHKLIRNYGV